MARLPDRFDLWVRKARSEADPDRQVDWVLGALVARPDLYFLNTGTKEYPQIGLAQSMEAPNPTDTFATVFSDAQRLRDFVEERKMPVAPRYGYEPPVIVSPMAPGLDWCVENKLGLLINPTQGDAVTVSPQAVAQFVEEWKQRGERQTAGFWIPNMTTEEEDFWQEHGL